MSENLSAFKQFQYLQKDTASSAGQIICFTINPSNFQRHAIIYFRKQLSEIYRIDIYN
jgi:hypothetical protein